MATEIINPVIDQDEIAKQCQELAALITRHTDGKGDGFHQTAIAQLEFQRESSVSTVLRGVCDPTFAILVQGKKELLLNEEIYRYGAAQYLVVSIDLPLSAFITGASPDKPYLGFKLTLDPLQLCDLIIQTNAMKRQPENAVRGLFVSTIDTLLLDCALRLAKLLDTPEDIPILAPLIVREIYYRLLVSEQCEAVRQIATSDSNRAVAK